MAPRGKGRPFQKGQSGNPKGSSQLAQVKARIASLSNAEVLELGSKILRAPASQLFVDNPAEGETNALETWVRALIRKGVEEADEKIFSVLMTRLLGRAPETIQGPNGGPIEIKALELSDEEKELRAEQLRQMRRTLQESQ